MRRASRLSFGWWLAVAIASGLVGCGARSSLHERASSGASDNTGAGEGGRGEGGASGDGAGGSTCNGISCDEPPAPTCLSSTTLTTFNPTGKCDGVQCVYAHTDAACPAGCSGGDCLPDPNAILLTVGSQHTCVTVKSGVKCWGHNDGGQLGNGTTKDSSVPVAVTGLSSGLLALAASGDSCAVSGGGALACWGHNESGQLGTGSTQGSKVPVGVQGLSSGVTAVAAGGLHTCAVTAGGAVQCWGDNSSGELGDGTTSASFKPVGVKGLSSGNVAVALGFGHSCALTSSGGVKCWGLNTYGELGNGAASEVLVKTPVDVKGLASGVIAITSSSLHTCALTSSGGVKCWGHNLDGELGDGTVIDSSTPVDVKGLSSGVVAIGAGTSHTCAVTQGGGVKCWGNNSFGQLGDGLTGKSPTPVDVKGLSSGVLKVALGFDHTCAAIALGVVKCWGGNFYSQLGDGTTEQSVVPVDVIGL